MRNFCLIYDGQCTIVNKVQLAERIETIAVFNYPNVEVKVLALPYGEIPSDIKERFTEDVMPYTEELATFLETRSYPWYFNKE